MLKNFGKTYSRGKIIRLEMHKLINPICHKEELPKLCKESTFPAYKKKQISSLA